MLIYNTVYDIMCSLYTEKLLPWVHSAGTQCLQSTNGCTCSVTSVPIITTKQAVYYKL